MLSKIKKLAALLLLVCALSRTTFVHSLKVPPLGSGAGILNTADNADLPKDAPPSPAAVADDEDDDDDEDGKDDLPEVPPSLLETPKNNGSDSDKVKPPSGTQTVAEIRAIISGVYKSNPENFDLVIKFATEPALPDFKAKSLIALHKIMTDAKHTDNPTVAVKLYNEMHRFIENNLGESDTDQALVQELQKLRDQLLSKAIVPSSAKILEAAVYLENCDIEGTMVEKVQDNLNIADDSLMRTTYEQVIENVRSVVPPRDLVRILEKISKYTHQNVAALIALYKDIEKVPPNLQVEFLGALSRLQAKKDYKETVSERLQLLVDNFFKNGLNNLFDKYICLNQRTSDGTLRYLGQCSPTDFRLCIGTTVTYIEPLFSQARNFTGFGLKIYNGHYINVQSDVTTSTNDFTLNVFGVGKAGSKYIWNIERGQGENLIIKNVYQDQYLCAGSSVALETNLLPAYTRDPKSYINYKKECRWNYNCS